MVYSAGVGVGVSVGVSVSETVCECLCTNIPGYPSALVNVAVGSACMCILYINVSINIEGKITTNFHMNLKKKIMVCFFFFRFSSKTEK